MASKSLVTELQTETALTPSTAPGGANGATIDLNMVGALTLVAVSAGDGSADGSFDVKAQEAPDDGTGSAGAWSDVAATDLRGAFTTGFDAATAVHDEVGYGGFKRFVRLVVVENIAATTAPSVAGVALKGELEGFV